MFVHPNAGRNNTDITVITVRATIGGDDVELPRSFARLLNLFLSNLMCYMYTRYVRRRLANQKVKDRQW